MLAEGIGAGPDKKDGLAESWNKEWVYPVSVDDEGLSEDIQQYAVDPPNGEYRNRIAHSHHEYSVSQYSRCPVIPRLFSVKVTLKVCFRNQTHSRQQAYHP